MWGGENVVVGGACKGEGHTDTSLSTAKWGWGTESYALGGAQRPPVSSQPRGLPWLCSPHTPEHSAAGSSVLGWEPWAGCEGSWSTGQARHRPGEFQGSLLPFLGSPSLS